MAEAAFPRPAGILRVGAGTQIRIAYTDASAGDFGISAPRVHVRRQAITGLESVSWIRQEHGIGIHTITNANPAPLTGPVGDAVITDQPRHAVSVITADCAPVALWTERGVVGAVHAGWKGLYAGIIERSIAAVRDLSGGDDVFAWLGPCIGPECYEFGLPELDQVAARYGDSVRSQSSLGTPACNLAAGVRAAVEATGGHWTGAAPACTACGERWFSWRARKSTGRQAMFVWRETTE